jgi:hypothetical protein
MRGCLFVIARSVSDEAISEVGMRLPRGARNDKRVFKNVVAQFIGQMRLMNQATTEI